MKIIAIIVVVTLIYGARAKRRAVARIYNNFSLLGIRDHWHVERDWEEAKKKSIFRYLGQELKEWWG